MILSFPTFRQILEALRVEWQNSEREEMQILNCLERESNLQSVTFAIQPCAFLSLPIHTQKQRNYKI